MARWTIAHARQHFSELLKEAEKEPQALYNRDRLVAAIVDAEAFAEFEAWRASRVEGSLADAFADLRRLAAEEGWEPPEVQRSDRPNAFAAVLDDLPR